MIFPDGPYFAFFHDRLGRQSGRANGLPTVVRQFVLEFLNLLFLISSNDSLLVYHFVKLSVSLIIQLCPWYTCFTFIYKSMEIILCHSQIFLDTFCMCCTPLHFEYKFRCILCEFQLSDI